ncbi:MAG: DUF6092 family protein, partial [Candidatus Bathyarchaeia archaeon]
YLFELACFLAMSARGCVDEPHLYGPLRLIDGLSRLVELSGHISCISRDPFLEKIRDQIEENKALVMHNREKFIGFLDHLVLEFAREIKRRARELNMSHKMGNEPFPDH